MSSGRGGKMSKTKFYLRYKKTIIGWFENSDGNLHYFVLKTGADSIPSGLGYPIGMFPVVMKEDRVFPDINHTPTHHDILHWLSDRVFPENRQGAYFLLQNLGLTHYDPWEIAKSTNASVLTDHYWMSDDKEDKYEEKHVRYRIKREAAVGELEKSFDELSVGVEGHALKCLRLR